MATLFDRLVGVNLDPISQLPEDQKIAIHSFAGALFELHDGEITGMDIAGYYDLSAEQITHAVQLNQLLQAAPNKAQFMRKMKDWLYMGETNTDAIYLDQANFIARMQREVTDQGGTLP